MKFIFVNSDQHLNSVCMSYFEHYCISMYLSGNLLLGSVKAFIHAWIPCWYTTSTSDLINDLKNIVNTIGCQKSNKD